MARLAGIAVFAILFAGAGCADESVDRALADLESEVPAKREAAERTLMDAGAEAHEACRRAFEKAAVGEVKARLERVVAWHAIETKSGALEAAWKDRWYIITADGAPIAWSHTTAERRTAEGRRGWSFASESASVDSPAGRSHIKATWTCLDDLGLTPVQITCTQGDLRGDGSYRETFSGGEVTCEIIRRHRSRDYLNPEPGTKVITRPGIHPFTLDWNLYLVLERASLAGFEKVAWEVYSLRDGPEAACSSIEVTFAGEEELEVAGTVFRTRRYVNAQGQERKDDGYWIESTKGLVKMAIRGVTLTLSDETTVNLLRPDSESAIHTLLNSALTALAGPAHDRDEAEQRLLRLDDRALGRCREALAAATDQDTRARLVRVCDWLDPDFKLAELGAMWKDAWFVVREEDYWGGSEHLMVEACDVDGKPGWKLKSELRLREEYSPFSKIALEARTLRDGRLKPVDMEVSSERRGSISRFSLRFDPDWVEVTELEVDGLKVPDEEREPERKLIADARERRWTNSNDVTRLIERASLARLPRLDLLVVEVLGRGGLGPFKVEEQSFRFAGEETIEHDGGEASVRKYARLTDGGNPEEYWIEDQRGLLKAQVQDMRILRTDEEGAKWK